MCLPADEDNSTCVNCIDVCFGTFFKNLIGVRVHSSQHEFLTCAGAKRSYYYVFFAGKDRDLFRTFWR